MGKKKEDYINDLIKVCFEYEELSKKQDQKTKDMQRMASLARQGKKDTKEFKLLKLQQNTVVDFGDVHIKMRKAISNLKKFKFKGIEI